MKNNRSETNEDSCTCSEVSKRTLSYIVSINSDLENLQDSVGGFIQDIYLRL